MAPPDGSRSTRIPTLSWESVVDDDAAESAPAAMAPPSVAPPPVVDAAPGAPSPSTPLTKPIDFSDPSTDAPTPFAAPEPAPSAPTPMVDDVIAPIQFAPLTLDASLGLNPLRERRSTPAEPEADAAPVIAAPSLTMPAAETPAVETPAVGTPAVETPAVEVDAPPAEAVPPVVAAAAAARVLADDEADRPSAELPQIVEATPVPAPPPVETPPPVATGPRLPQTQAAAPAPPEATPFNASAANTTSVPVQRHRRKSRRGLKLVLVLVVLGAIIAGAVVFGQPYLFPGEWDAETQPFAEAVENASGAEFVETVTLTAEPPADYSPRLATELVGDWSDDQPMWRALGLLNGPATPESVTEQLIGWQDAVYSTEDGQIYRDQSASGPPADADITAAMATASLDQRYRWSVDQGERTLDDQALTVAEVQRWSGEIVAASPFAVADTPLDATVVAFMPPVVAYRLLAPAVYAEFATDIGSLDGMGLGGPGTLPLDTPVLAPAPAPADTDRIVSSPAAMDRSFWYLVLGGYLDPRAAYDASEAIVENALTMATRGESSCVYATFAGGDVAQTTTLRSALETWTAAAPAEFAAGFSVLPDGTLQLVSCDPGTGFEHANRLGVARELIAWRTAELATIEAVTAAFGGESDPTDAWLLVEASAVGPTLASLPAGTAPPETAATARAAITELFTPVGE